MKVHAFKVEASAESAKIDEVFSLINSQPNLRDRIRVIKFAELRAEAIEMRDGVWLIDFVRIRTDHGPGRVSRDAEVEGFDFEEEEGFGEETAALYDSATGYILVQYNHHGVRACTIAEYLSVFNSVVNNQYSFKPKYDEDVEERLFSHGITRKISFAIDANKMTSRDRENGKSLSAAISCGQDIGADKINMTMSVSGDRNRSLKDKVKDIIGDLLGLAKVNPDAVSKIEVSGKEDKDSITEALDLIGQRLFIEFNDMKVGYDLRYPREKRWEALFRAKHKWSGMLKL